MVSATYDHLVAIIVVGVIFIGTVAALPFSTLLTVDQQQIRNTALNVFDSMLLDVGSPSDWGSVSSGTYFDQTTVEKFGLAYADPFSKYVLDIDKVQRINVTNPTGFVEYDQVRKLLDIENYGFQLAILRPFQVNWNLTIEPNNVVHFNVTIVRTEDETPIPNAEVRVTTMAAWVKSTNEFDFVTLDPIIRYTNASGMCEERQTVPAVDGTISQVVSFMRISVAGMLTTVIAYNTSPFSGLVTVNTSGDTIILSVPENLVPRGTNAEGKLNEIAAYKNDMLLPLFEVSKGTIPPDMHFNHGAGPYWQWVMEIPGLRVLNPTALLIWAELTLKKDDVGGGKPGRQLVLITGSLDLTSPERIFSFGGDLEGKNPIVTMRRLVVISDMTYVAQIAFWRERI